MTVSRAKGDKAACDRLASQIVRIRGMCQYPGCGSVKDLQCCHIISRTYNNTRTDLGNLLCLCASHHRLIDTFPDEKLRVTEAVYGRGHYDELRQRAESTVGQRFDWQRERERLKALLEARLPASAWGG